MKTKIGVLPLFEFEVTISTFLNEDKFELIFPTEKTNKLLRNYCQNIYGDWCAPLKFYLANIEDMVNKGAQKIISIDLPYCKYPLMMSSMKQWGYENIDYYLVMCKDGVLSLGFVKNIFLKLRKVDHSINFLNFLFKLPLALKRLSLVESVKKEYFKSMAVSKNPRLLNKNFVDFKKKFILCSGYKESIDCYKKFTAEIKKNEKPKFKILLSGDYSILLTSKFPLIDIHASLAKYKVELINPFSFLKSYFFMKFSDSAKKARLMLGRRGKNHVPELFTLAQILAGINEGVDGIIYLKPIMCSPGDNVSFILKKKNYYNIPFVEISYDEHAGLNGVLTRLEAFMNIVQERREKKV